MYFVYQKQINVASRQNYDVDSIVEWFQELMDQDYIKENYGVDVTASDIVYDIFCDTDWWYDDFIQHFELEEEVIDNITVKNSDSVTILVQKYKENIKNLLSNQKKITLPSPF